MWPPWAARGSLTSLGIGGPVDLLAFRAVVGPPATVFTAPGSPRSRELASSSAQRDLAACHRDRLGRQRARGGPGDHAAVLDAELAAVTGAVDGAAGDLVHEALQVGADRAEPLELARRGLGDHDLLGREHLPAADRDLARAGQRRAAARTPAVGGLRRRGVAGRGGDP